MEEGLDGLDVSHYKPNQARVCGSIKLHLELPYERFSVEKGRKSRVIEVVLSLKETVNTNLQRSTP